MICNVFEIVADISEVVNDQNSTVLDYEEVCEEVH
jgi:hypothetical protein